MGRRFGSQYHKALAPLQFGLGTLPLLLRQLRQIGPGGHVCVVTGHHADTVATVVRQHLPSALCIDNARYNRSDVLQSIAAAMALPELAGSGAWVLFADTFYHPRTLARLLSTPQHGAAVAVLPWRSEADHPVGIRLKTGHENCIAALGPFLTDAPWMMAPAVYWPEALWPAVLQGADDGLSSQWQVLHTLLSGRDALEVTALPVAEEEISDIDTPSDLEAIRAKLLGSHALDYFRENLCKDARNLSQPDIVRDGLFVKTCTHESEAAHEFSVLDWLRQQQGETLAPLPHRVEGKRLTQQHIPGVRLFDLLRLLRQIARGQATSDAALAGLAEHAAVTLLSRSLQRLGRIQRALMVWPQARSLPAYPLDSHVQELLRVLLRLLHLPPMTADCRRELTEFRTVWETQDACIPFRDATPKNTLVAVSALAPHRWSCSKARLAAVTEWLQHPKSAERARLVDFDFTSTRHLTAPEDDVISLLGHAGSTDTAARLLTRSSPQLSASDEQPSWLDWLRIEHTIDLPGIRPDPARAARALFVRYLRFGGRKLIYRIVNPRGYAVRFRYDDPTPYFRRLPAYLYALDPAFATRWPALSELLETLAEAVSALPPWDPCETEQDAYLAAIQQPVTYWQESPLESMGLSA